MLETSSSSGMRLLYVTDDPVLWDKIGITEPQKAVLEGLMRDVWHSWTKSDGETYDKIYPMLTPKQQKALQEVDLSSLELQADLDARLERN